MFALAVLAGALAGSLFNKNPTPIYEASTMVLVEGRQTPGTPSSSDLRTSAELAAYYSSLIKTRSILEKVAEQLPAGYDVGRLSGALRVTSPGSFIEIGARDRDPVLAADIANISAQTFIEDLQERQFAQIAQFQASLSQYGISQDPSIIAAQVATMQTLSILEEARTPTQPSNPPNQWRDVLLGALLGLIAAGFVVFVIEYFDDSIKSVEELKSISGLELAGSVTGGLSPSGSVPLQRLSGGRLPLILDDEDQRSPLAEAYKYVVLNLEFSTLTETDMNTIMVTSALPGEGKTTTATNVAISMARGGKSVVLVDSDLRKPAMHTILGLEPSRGLTSALLGTATIDEVLLSSGVENLKVVVSGPLPPDSTRVLRSPRMVELIKALEERADIVIFDSPPVLAVADPIVLAAQVDGVLLVVDSNGTRRDALRRTAQNLNQVNPNILGAVLNKVKSGRSGGYYYYDSYHSYSADGAAGASDGRFRRLTGLLRNGRRPWSHRDSEKKV